MSKTKKKWHHNNAYKMCIKLPHSLAPNCVLDAHEAKEKLNRTAEEYKRKSIMKKTKRKEKHNRKRNGEWLLLPV